MDSDLQDQQRQDGLVITSVVMTAMAGIFVCLRCISRFYLIRNPGPDDYLIIGATIFTIGYVVDIFVLRANHLGFPMTMLKLTEDTQATLAIQVMYCANIFCIKTSILYTYVRFAVTRTFRWLCIGTIILHSVFFFICFVVTLAQCRPLSKMWDMTGTVQGSCINTTAFFYSTSSFNILTDIWILALPIRTLRELTLPRQEKIALFLIFGVGTFACVASIVRLHTIYTYTEAADPFREGILVNLWSIIEVTMAISCASVSAIKPIFSSRQRRVTLAARSTTTRQGSTSVSVSRTGTGRDVRSKKSGNRFDLSPWHMRLGSKDVTRSSADDDNIGGRSSADAMVLTSYKPIRLKSRKDSFGREGASPPVPPQLARVVAVGRPEMEEMNSEASMIMFTPVTEQQPPRGSQRGANGQGQDEENAGLSNSSGSILVLQK
ncbi:hypothetical protein QBC46DRAFT_362537 [Diplogelasinospora grovesii]|uniref:Rhodopsin domain-containing protein n=1 Tax=Diplogelasinospora grovesii TaxID=303347 RepID=A0AAN6S7D2_9PEZI|nr:hypothetical protein QBC46DRAFT_362537 [Diplogelasinospora grovesii]